MKKWNSLLISASCSLVFFSCSSSNAVSTTCSKVEDGTTMTYKLSAPAKDQDINKMVMVLDLSLEDLGITSDDLNNPDTKDLISSIEDMYKQLLKSMYGIDPNDVVIKTTDKKLSFEITISDLKDFEDHIGSDYAQAMLEFFGGSYVYEEAIKGIEEANFTCS